MSRILRRLSRFRRSEPTPVPAARTPRDLRARLWLSPLEEREVPATFTVNVATDAGGATTGAGSGTTGDLRYCIVQANTLGGADIIQFDAAVFSTPQTITLASALPVITTAGGAQTFNGTGARNVTVSGNNLYRPFTLGTITSAPAVTFNDITISNGRSAAEAGGVFVGGGGVLTLNRCTLSGNVATGNGGALYFYNNGSLTINSSTFTNNSAGGSGGGAAYLYGTLTATVSNSTIFNNTSTSANGGGAFRLNTTGVNLTVRNSTITGNTATAGTGGGISGAGNPVTIVSSIVTGNTGGGVPDIANSTSAVNVSNSAIGSAGFTYGTNTGNLSVANSSTTALFGGAPALTDNGGPTNTVVLLGSSLAVNAGSNPGGLANDQRGPGYVRSFGAGVDMGAFEVQPPGIPSAVGSAPTVTVVGGTSITITVEYSDLTGTNQGILFPSLGTGDIFVTGPGGFTGVPTFVGATPAGNGTPRTATYTLTPPGGFWDGADNGTYSINVVANQVSDLDGTFVPAGVAGTFLIATPPGNDFVSGAIDLVLNVPAAGTTVSAADDYQTSAVPYGTTYLTNTPSAAAGRDVVYRFTAPAADTYTFRVRAGATATTDFLLYAASTVTAGTVTALDAANRTAATANGAEDLVLSLTNGQVIFLVVDGNTLTGGDTFTLVASRTAPEANSAGNNTQAGAQSYSASTFGLVGSVEVANDIDYYSLGSLAAGELVFAMTDASGSAVADTSMRLTNATDTLEFDDDGADVYYGTLGYSSVIAGAAATAGTNFLQVLGFNNATAVGMYQLYAVVQPAAASATVEVEGNDTIATANAAANNYYTGSMSSAADADYFGFGAAAGDRLFIALDSSPGRTAAGFNGVLTLFDGAGNLLLSVNGDTTGAIGSGAGSLTASLPTGGGEGLIWSVQTTGNYYARVTTAGTTGNYILSVSKNGGTGGGGLLPTLAGITAPPQSVNDTATIAPFATATVSGSGTITAVVNYAAANGSFANLGGFTGSPGSYTMVGTPAAVQTALNGLLFDPSDNRVAVGGTESTSFTVNLYAGTPTVPLPPPDATNSQTTVVSTSVNDAPGFSGVVAAPQPVNDNATIAPFATVNIDDPDPGQIVTVTVGYTAAAGTFTNLGGFTGSAGSYTFTGTAPAATTALQGIRFNPVSNVLAVGATSNVGFTLTVNDTIAPTVTDIQTTVRVTGANDAPVLGGVVTTPQPVLDTATVQPFTSVTINDADPGQTVTVTVSYPAAEGTFTALGGFTGSAGSYSFTGSPAAAQTAIQGLTFVPAPNLVAVGATTSTTLTIAVVDSGPGVSNSQTTVASKSVNNAPSFTAGTNQTVNEDSGAASVTWATAVVGGPGAEAGQTVNFLVSNDNNGLFLVQPTISASGVLSYTPALNQNGSATVTVQLMDTAGTDDGGSDTSAVQTFTITVDAVNDAPTFSLPSPAVTGVTEGAGLQTVANFATAVSAGPTADETSVQSVSFSVSVVSATGNLTFSTAPAIDPTTGDLTFQAAPDGYGTATLSVTLTDTGGGTNTSAAQTFTITVDPVNDDPVVTLDPARPVAVAAGASTPLGSIATITDIDDTATFPVTATVTVSVLSGLGTFSGTGFTSGDGTNSISVTGTLAQVNAALLTLSFTTPATGNPASVTVTVDADDLGNVGGGSLTASDTFDLGIQEKPRVQINGGSVDFTEEGSATVVAPSLLVTDTDSAQLSKAVVTVVGATLDDVLAYTGALPSGVIADASVPGVITFTGAADVADYEALLRTVTYANTNPLNPVPGARSVTFVVTDDVSTALVGDAATQTVTVLAVNDAPELTVAVGGTVSVFEQATVAVPGVSVDDPDAGTNPIRVTLSTSNGTLSASGAGVTIGGIGTGTLTIEGPKAAVNAALAAATFTGATDFVGTATITVGADDLGGVGSPGPLTDSGSFTVTVNGVNDAPSFTPGSNVSVDEDSGSTSVPWATNVLKGPADESGQTVTFLVSNTLPGVFAAQPAIDANGNLTFTVRPNAVGTATVTVRAQDNGGTANGGVNVSPLPAQTFTITITPVNDTPSFTAGANVDVTEDSGPRTFTGWARSISTGPTDESGQTVEFLVTSSNVSSSGGPLFSVLPAVDANGTLTFTPAPNANGTASVSVRIKDSGGGTTDTSAAQTFTITVMALNDPPQFTISQSAISAGPSTNPVTLPGFVTGINAGAPDEAGQTFTFEVTNNGEVLFTQQPTITPILQPDGVTYLGQLTFTQAAGASGVATVTVRLSDSGGNTSGVNVTPPVQTFTITLKGSNSAPSFNLTATANQTAAEDSGPQTVAGLATNIAAGLPSESGQTLTFLVSASLPGLFSTQPAINPTTGTLTYTPAANAVGTTTVTVRLMDDGGTLFNGADTSAAQTFTITLTPVNDAPSFTIPAGPVAADPVNGTRTVTNFATSISPGPGSSESGQTVTFLVTTPQTSLFTSLPAINPTTGTLTFTPAAGASGSAFVTVRLQDNGSPVGTSAAQTFTIVVATGAQNSPPTAGSDSITVAYNSGPTAVPVLANDSSAPDNGETLSVSAVGSAANGVVTLTGGVVFYAPATGFSGNDSFTYTLSDGNGGTATGTVSVSVLPPVPVDPPTPTPPTSTTTPDLVALTDASNPRVVIMNAATGTIVADFIAFPGFAGGVNATVADVTGDGTPDIIVGAGAGGGPVVKVFDGKSFDEVASFYGFLPSLRGGVHVAAADVNGDGRADLVLGAGAGGGPHVKVVDGTKLGQRDRFDLPAPGALLGSFFAYAADFLGGVNVAAADTDGDGKAEVVTGAGPGGSPHVKVFAGGTLKEILSVIPYNPGFRGGVNVAAGDLDGDGLAEIVTGAAAGGGPHVGIYNGRTGASKGQFFAFAPDDTSGVTVAVKPLSAGGATLVTASGSGGLKTYTAGEVDDLLDGALFPGIAVG